MMQQAMKQQASISKKSVELERISTHSALSAVQLQGTTCKTTPGACCWAALELQLQLTKNPCHTSMISTLSRLSNAFDIWVLKSLLQIWWADCSRSDWTRCVLDSPAKRLLNKTCSKLTTGMSQAVLIWVVSLIRCDKYSLYAWTLVSLQGCSDPAWKLLLPEPI